jgi:hypothetical protein
MSSKPDWIVATELASTQNTSLNLAHISIYLVIKKQQGWREKENAQMDVVIHEFHHELGLSRSTESVKHENELSP